MEMNKKSVKEQKRQQTSTDKPTKKKKIQKIKL